MKIGKPFEKITISINEKYNPIAYQWDKNIYFMVKNETFNEESIIIFISILKEQLKLAFNRIIKKTVLLWWIM